MVCKLFVVYQPRKRLVYRFVFSENRTRPPAFFHADKSTILCVAPENKCRSYFFPRPKIFHCYGSGFMGFEGSDLTVHTRTHTVHGSRCVFIVRLKCACMRAFGETRVPSNIWVTGAASETPFLHPFSYNNNNNNIMARLFPPKWQTGMVTNRVRKRHLATTRSRQCNGIRFLVRKFNTIFDVWPQCARAHHSLLGSGLECSKNHQSTL